MKRAEKEPFIITVSPLQVELLEIAVVDLKRFQEKYYQFYREYRAEKEDENSPLTGIGYKLQGISKSFNDEIDLFTEVALSLRLRGKVDLKADYSQLSPLGHWRVNDITYFFSDNPKEGKQYYKDSLGLPQMHRDLASTLFASSYPDGSDVITEFNLYNLYMRKLEKPGRIRLVLNPARQ